MVDAALPDILALLHDRDVVLEAPPGTGKTTRVPPALLAGRAADRPEIVVLEPRRLAARLAAARVASELGETPGATVGHRVRFDEVGGTSTPLWYVTEGVFLRRLLADPLLERVGVVVLDEFHERSLDADLALGLLRGLRRSLRPDLRLVVMSATLDAAPIAAFLDAAAVRVEARQYDVRVEYAPPARDAALEASVAVAVGRLLAEEPDGHVLVFLPGAAEIRRALATCLPVAARYGAALLPLHGDLPLGEQARAVAPSPIRKVILATNVAETSITIDGVVGVVDSGLARVARHAPWSGLRSLAVAPISRASAAQRAGRAGRTRPGRCLRLYARLDHDARPERELPEVARADLSEALLLLAGLRDDARRPDVPFAWLDAPPPSALEAARALLQRLGALDDAGRPTPRARSLLRWPVHPRLARVLDEAVARGRVEDGCGLAALLAERDPRRSGRGGFEPGRGPAARAWDPGEAPLDPRHVLADLLQRRLADRSGRPARRSLGEGGGGARVVLPDTYDAGAVALFERARERLLRLAPTGRSRPPAPLPPADRDALLSALLLAGYPDRVGRVVPAAGTAPGAGASDVLLPGGGRLRLSDAAGLPDGELVVVLDADERREGRRVTSRARALVPLDAEWLQELFPERLADEAVLAWNADRERVEASSRVTYDGLLLEERPGCADPAAVADLLFTEASRRGAAAFCESPADLDLWLGRLAFVRRHRPELALPEPGPELLEAALRDACAGRRSFAELRRADLPGRLAAHLGPGVSALLERLAPTHVRLPGGRRLALAYPPDGEPSASSRLQDFFGLAESPLVLDGRVPLVLHLLAPNGRDVQVTTDLAGFWQRHYPALARELRRRYPRHAWPDNPLSAVPPSPGRPR